MGINVADIDEYINIGEPKGSGFYESEASQARTEEWLNRQQTKEQEKLSKLQFRRLLKEYGTEMMSD